LEHSCSLSVRSYECDSYGHVNNAVYLNYLEFARHRYLDEIGLPLSALRTAGYAIWVVEITIRYRLPAVTDDPLTILTRPLRRSRVSGALEQRILRGTDELATAEVKWVCVNSAGRPAPIPAEFERDGLTP
jgi:YbgC/YbaW family acyl-CoA thioester hydrolase